MTSHFSLIFSLYFTFNKDVLDCEPLCVYLFRFHFYFFTSVFFLLVVFFLLLNFHLNLLLST